MQTGRPQDDALTGRSALLIDDNAFMRRLVRSLLRQFGFEDIQEAADGSEALLRVTERRFDVVVCDWMMEPTDGYAFVRSLRQHAVPAVRTLPVVMLTAVAAQNKVMAARDAGVTEYLVKPVSSGKLRIRLIAALTRPRNFVVAGDYVGPDRRRRDDVEYHGTRRRLSDRLQSLSDEESEDWADAAANYATVLRGDIERMQVELAGIAADARLSFDAWRSIHRTAHDLKGQAPTFGYVAAAEIAGSLERLLRPAMQTPEMLERAAERRLRAGKTHVEALTLILEQGITGRSTETDALTERLNRTVERVHRESLS